MYLFALPIEIPSCGTDAICMPRADVRKFVTLAKDRQCLDKQAPVLKLDPLVLVQDSEGRVFYSGGTGAKTYKVRLTWCHYSLTAEAPVKLTVAVTEPSVWGFRLRPKAVLGLLPTRLVDSSFASTVDAGILLDFFYLKYFNANLMAGFRSLGVGFGLDLTANFGLYLGYAVGYEAPHHNGFVGVSFAF